MESQPTTDTFVTLPDVILGLRAGVAAWGARGVLGRVLMFLLYRRLGEIDRRIARMLARFRAGQVLRRRGRVAEGPGLALGPASVPGCADEGSIAVESCAVRAMAGFWDGEAVSPDGVTGEGAGLPPVSGAGPRRLRVKRVWPGRFGWLVRACGFQAAGYAEQLRFVLAQPEMVALLAASPQAGRVLLPLCRALAVETDVLRPGVVRPVPVPRPPRAPRVRKLRPKLDLGRIPLPRGVLSAARREGYGRLW